MEKGWDHSISSAAGGGAPFWRRASNQGCACASMLFVCFFCLSHEGEPFVFRFLPIVLISGTTRESKEVGQTQQLPKQ